MDQPHVLAMNRLKHWKVRGEKFVLTVSFGSTVSIAARWAAAFTGKSEISTGSVFGETTDHKKKKKKGTIKASGTGRWRCL